MDSKLFWRNIAGAPAIITDKENVTTGTVIWVQATDGSDSDGYGNNPEAPLASLAYAFSDDRPTAGKNDLILLMPGHTESIAAAAGIACDIAGVTVRGLGEGANRPILTFDTDAGADIDIDAANITFENISFRCNIADLAAAIDVNAANFTMRNCSFIGTDAADEAFLIAIITDAAANDMTIENCQFYFLNTVDATAITTTSTECIRLVGADRATIKNCYIEGDFTTSAVNGITTASYGILLLENNITNIATENITGGIDLYTGSTGFMDKNVLYVDDPTSPEDAIDDANLANGVNWVSNAIGDAPIMWGAADALGVEGKLDIVTGFHTVAVKDTTTDAQMRDVIGKKDDTALTAVVTNKSLMGYIKGLMGFQTVAVKDTTTDAQMRDVVGKKDDTAVTTVGTTKSIMAHLKGVMGFHTVAVKDTTTDAQMRDVVGKKDDTALTAVVTNKSLMGYVKGLIGFHTVAVTDTTTDAQMRDVVGKKDDAAIVAVVTNKSLVAMAKGLMGFHTVAVKDTTTDAQMRDVVGKKDDTAVTVVGTTKSIIAHVKGIMGFHTVAAKDTTDDAQLRDVIGKKDDTVLTAMEDTKSIAAYVRSLFTETLAYYRSARKTITLDGSSGTGAIGVNTLFTVTGGVEIINVKAVCSTNVAGAGSAEVGIAGATAIFLTQVVDATDIDAGNVWHDATTDAEYELASVYDARGYILGNGQDIILTVGAANLTSGVIGFQVTWIPITSDGSVVAA